MLLVRGEGPGVGFCFFCGNVACVAMCRLGGEYVVGLVV